jgi:hypothetical protein
MMLAATTAEPVATAGITVVATPGFRPTFLCSRPSHMAAAPPAKAAKLTILPAVDAAAADMDPREIVFAAADTPKPAAIPTADTNILARTLGR